MGKSDGDAVAEEKARKTIGVARIFVGGGTRPTPPSRAHVEAVAGSWGSVSAQAVNRVMGQSEINITNKYR